MCTTWLLSLALVAPSVQDDRDAGLAPADPRALALIEEFHTRLYDPIAQGLESLTFEMLTYVRESRGDRLLSTTHVRWSREGGSEAEAKFADVTAKEDMSDSVGRAIEWTTAWSEDHFETMAEDFVAIQTNRWTRRFLQGTLPQLGETRDGLVRIECPALPGVRPWATDRVLLFDTNGVLKHSSVVLLGTQGGPVQRDSQKMTWRALEEGSGLVRSEALVTSWRPKEHASENVTYEYEQLGGFHFVTRMNREIGTIRYTNFVVNGTPVAAGADDDARGSADGEDRR